MKNLYSEIMRIMRDAGKIIVAPSVEDIQGSINVKNEDFSNLVTFYDVAVQKYLIKELSSLCPTAAFLAEEDDKSSVTDSGYCFIIDPIDGTTNFTRAYRYSAISVALAKDGKVIFGAVYEPYHKEMYHAIRGEGAYLNGEPISVSKNTIEHSIASVGAAPYYKNEIGRAVISVTEQLYYACMDFRRIGSAALDLCFTAAGKFELFCELRLSPWDFAAGALILTEAGGSATDEHGNELNPFYPSAVLASNGVTHPDLMKIVEKALQA
jgi:myo-inositol-1(or 4)-monophosphatase